MPPKLTRMAQILCLYRHLIGREQIVGWAKGQRVDRARSRPRARCSGVLALDLTVVTPGRTKPGSQCAVALTWDPDAGRGSGFIPS